MDDGRRESDRWLRDRYDTMSQKLAVIETAQKLYHDEIKSITEKLHDELQSVDSEVKALNRVVFGGENPGILENIRGLMWKFGIATTAVITVIGFTFKIFSPALTKVADKIAGVETEKKGRRR